MLPDINLTSNRKFRIRNFEEDKIATLKANKGLHYIGKSKDFFLFKGNYYLTGMQGNFIDSFEIEIFIEKSYPNTFPLVYLMDDKIEKTVDYHINPDFTICFEHTYITNVLAKNGLRIYDFIAYFLPRYFSWILIKQSGNAQILQEWSHYDYGTIQFYEALLNITDKDTIRLFLESYCKVTKICRNTKCYCGSGKKLKHCHFEAARMLTATPKDNIKKDIALFGIM